MIDVKYKLLPRYQPYVPQLKGGEIDRSYVAGKSEQYNGGRNNLGFTLGVSASAMGMSAFKGDSDFSGSWGGDAGVTTPKLNDIFVSKAGSVVKVSLVRNASNIDYTILLGTDEQIQTGFEYPNVFRVLEPDVDVNSEYYHYDNGGAYPWRSLYPNLLLTPNTEMGNY